MRFWTNFWRDFWLMWGVSWVCVGLLMWSVADNMYFTVPFGVMSAAFLTVCVTMTRGVKNAG